MANIYRDQELRFTVHESPDYYQLKVSVFNDDKKTELIGETRIALEGILVPGGGQKDTWHTLHCKGRFAGEIRIELTYYDTRPKEEQLPERQQEAAADDHQAAHKETVGGPRGLRERPLKRRPLPANPTDVPRPSMPEHAHSSPLPHPTPQVIHQPTPSYPDRYGRRDHMPESTPPSGSRYQHPRQPSSTESPISHDPNQEWMHGRESSAQDYEHHPEEDQYDHNATFEPTTQVNHNGNHEQYAPLQAHQDHQRHGGMDDNYVDPFRISQSSSDNHGHPRVEQPGYSSHHDNYTHSPPSVPHSYYATPDVRTPGNAGPLDHQPHRHSLPSIRGYNERSPVQQHSPSGSFNPYTQTSPDDVDDDVPPPPPAHRSNSGVSPSPLSNGRSHSDSCAPIPGTAPLHIRKERGSFSNSPLSQVQTNPLYAEYAPSPSPSYGQHYAHSPAMALRQDPNPPTPVRESHSRRSISPIRNGHAMPPSLVPGHAPEPPLNSPQDVAYDTRPRHGEMRNYEPAPQYQLAAPTRMQPRSHHAATINSQSPLQTLERGPNQRPHRASAPVAQPRAVSPASHVPIRKSVSPQPESSPAERRGSSIPFGPDSYDAFNPFVSSASAGPSPGARYETPEQAKEAAIQHEREKKLGDGPIIGSDGRVIDPSDHLPTDTWAPEPETKAPRKTAQVNLRFRNSPQGARTPHDASPRPASISTPTYNSGANNMPDNISPVTAARARLQKKTRVSPAQPSSSPIVPTVNTALQNPVLRSTASDYPLREHENYGYGSSPTYNRPSPTGVPPPVPSKVPIGMGQEDWRRDTLSEELSRIDIGVGGGRSRRSRYHG